MEGLRQNRAFRKRPANAQIDEAEAVVRCRQQGPKQRPIGLAPRWAMIVRLIVQTFIWYGAMGILLFLAAGTFAWPGAWTYLVLMVTLSFTLGADLARNDPGLLRGRMGSPVQRDQPAADKMLLIALLLFMFAWLVLMGSMRSASLGRPPRY